MTPRALALSAIGHVKGQRQPIDRVLRQNPRFRALNPPDQALVRALLIHLFRHHGALDAAFAPLLAKPLDRLSPAALGPLRLGTTELLVMDAPPHAVLNETVALAPKSLRGLVNAVLRALVAGRAMAAARLRAAPAVPPWLLNRWTQDFGTARASDLALGLRAIPDLDLSLKPGVAFGTGVEILPQHRRVPACDPRTLPGFAAGDWWVQDLAASLPVRMAGPVAGLRVLDACAAPGGKTLQLAAGGAQVTALDRSPSRLTRMQENLKRTRLSANLVCADALTYVPSNPFDLVVLDAPCSASGTLRRHPEWPWIHSRHNQLANVPIQAALLRQALTWLKPKGRLLYAVCSLFPEEGEAQIEALLNDRPQVRLQGPAGPLPPHTWVAERRWLRTLPNTQLNMDGFFAAILSQG